MKKKLLILFLFLVSGLLLFTSHNQINASHNTPPLECKGDGSDTECTEYCFTDPNGNRVCNQACQPTGGGGGCSGTGPVAPPIPGQPPIPGDEGGGTGGTGGTGGGGGGPVGGTSCFISVPRSLVAEVGENTRLDVFSTGTAAVEKVRYSVSRRNTTWFSILCPGGVEIGRLDPRNTGFSCRNPVKPRSGYYTNIVGISPGTWTVESVGVCAGGNKETGAKITTVTVIPQKSWFQVVNGTVISGGSVSSDVPNGQDFLEDGVGGYPGNAVYNRSSVNTGEGNLSSTDWKAKTPYNPKKDYTYRLFDLLARTALINFDPVNSPIITASTLTNSTPDNKGYVWRKREGLNPNLTLNGDLNINGSDKLVLFVDGDLTINGNITIQDPRNGFLLVIVGGDIIINPTVTNVDGIFFTDQRLNTGMSSTPLSLNGSYVANEGFLLDRTSPTNAPAETFTYLPEYLLSYPSTITLREVTWLEVAP